MVEILTISLSIASFKTHVKADSQTLNVMTIKTTTTDNEPVWCGLRQVQCQLERTVVYTLDIYTQQTYQGWVFQQ